MDQNLPRHARNPTNTPQGSTTCSSIPSESEGILQDPTAVAMYAGTGLWPQPGY
jgi:hypothetical protein